MASNTKATEKETKTVVAESVYSREELAKSHKAFNASYEIVDVALRLTGKDEATFTEAQKIVEKFKNKEVK